MSLLRIIIHGHTRSVGRTGRRLQTVLHFREGVPDTWACELFQIVRRLGKQSPGNYTNAVSKSVKPRIPGRRYSFKVIQLIDIAIESIRAHRRRRVVR